MQALSALNQTGPKCWIEDLDIRAPMAICVMTSLSSIGLSNTVAIAMVWAVSFLYFLSFFVCKRSHIFNLLFHLFKRNVDVNFIIYCNINILCSCRT